MPLRQRLLEDARLLRSYLRRAPRDFDSLLAELDHWDEVVQRWGGKPLAASRTFEIGYGARPYRMLAMQALGADTYGVDAERPVLRGDWREYRQIVSQNGWERLAKTVLRRLLFDRQERAWFRESLHRRGLEPPVPQASRFLVADAADCQPPGTFDLIYSFAVFEHIKRPSLERLVRRMPGWLAPDGLALIVPDIYTGLHGAHLLEWNADTFDLPIRRRSEPWEHLRQRRFTANTTLNEMSRAEYHELFSAHFEILEVIDPPRGRASEFLTPEIRAELRDYTEQDLLDENPLFVLRRRAGPDVRQPPCPREKAVSGKGDRQQDGKPQEEGHGQEDAPEIATNRVPDQDGPERRSGQQQADEREAANSSSPGVGEQRDRGRDHQPKRHIARGRAPEECRE